jgi:hypothetical protein
MRIVYQMLLGIERSLSTRSTPLTASLTTAFGISLAWGYVRRGICKVLQKVPWSRILTVHIGRALERGRSINPLLLHWCVVVQRVVVRELFSWLGIKQHILGWPSWVLIHMIFIEYVGVIGRCLETRW